MQEIAYINKYTIFHNRGKNKTKKNKKLLPYLKHEILYSSIIIICNTQPTDVYRIVEYTHSS